MTFTLKRNSQLKLFWFEEWTLDSRSFFKNQWHDAVKD